MATEEKAEKKQWRRTVSAPADLAKRAGDVMDHDMMDMLLEGCVKIDASDLHLTFGEPPVYRRHGQMIEMSGFKTMTHEDMVEGVNVFLGQNTPDNRYWVRYFESGGADIAYSLGDLARFRVSVFQQRQHPALALRMIPYTMLTFEQLGLVERMMVPLLTRPRGIILTTGPTGSGKSTTLASMINWINENRAVHIVTIEEPIEYYHPNKRCLINQREVGVDVITFAEAVVRNMRSDPDVILSARCATSRRCARRCRRRRPATLCSRRCTPSARRRPLPSGHGLGCGAGEIRAMLSTSLAPSSPRSWFRAVTGRAHCAHEIMMGEAAGSAAIGNLIRERKTSQMRTTIQSSANLGMKLMEQSLAKFVDEGRSSSRGVQQVQ